MTVLFGDVAGSTELARGLSPEVWQSTLATYFADVSRAATEQGGRVEKFIGDAVVAVFGVEATHEDDALRAVDCARVSLERIARQAADLRRTRGVDFSVRFGIASGQVALSERDSSFAIGEVMNRAARLQAAALADGIVMDVRTWLLVRGAVPTRPIEPIAAKGFSRPLRAWQIADAAGADAGEARTPLVDRRSQLDDLVAALGAGLRRPGVPAVVLAGEPGVGKSRLVAEAARRMAPDARFLTLRCRRDGRRLGYWPLYQLAEALGGDVPRGQGPQGKEEIFWTLRELLREAAAQRPVVLVLDDCQWMSPAVREFADGLDDPDLDVRAVLMLSGRVDEPPLTRGSVAMMRVPPLGQADAQELAATVAARLGQPVLSGSLNDLARRSAGNPLYLEQLVHLQVDAEGRTDLIAPSAEAAVGARLDHLGVDAQRLLAIASALGGSCVAGDLEKVAAALDPPLDQTFDETLAQLLGDGLLVTRARSAGELEVESPVVAEVAYGRLPLADRAHVHAQVAVLVEARVDRHPSEIELCALHAGRAHAAWLELRPGGPEERHAAVRAARALCAAAQFAVSRGDLSMALQTAGQVGGLDSGLPGLELEIAAVETYATAAAGRADETLARIAEARKRWDTGGNLAAAVQLTLNEAVARSTMTGRWQRSLIGQARELAYRADDPAVYARVLLLEGIGHMEDGDYVTAESVLHEAFGHARRARWCFGATEIYGNLALCLAYGNTPAPAATAICAQLHAELKDAHTVRAAVGCPAALLADMTCDSAAATNLLDEGRSILAGIRHQPGLAGLDMFRATLAERHGDHDGAGQALDSAIRRFDAIGFSAGAQSARLWHATFGAYGPPGAQSGEDPRGAYGPPGAQNGDGPAVAQGADSWDVEVLTEQAAAAAALREGRPDAAAEHVVRAGARLDGVHGAGARITPLLVSLRLAGLCRDRGLVERVADLARADAEMKRDVRALRSIDALV
ncbi:AAA family ATPase [Nonomuraea sp. NPDC050451]|uniref:adenylate/guanylate cyclase domain-containing protein n=1 Tax=Nonomuraea sp. NPDC050451 TaxID=3364364 RepID=UPI00378DC23D